MSIFGSEEIILNTIKSDELNLFYVGFDLRKYRYDDLVNQISRALVDFAYGYHEGILESKYNIDLLREAAKSIYTIKEFQTSKKTYLDDDSELDDTVADKYLKRGEFGELILHLLLRDFHDSTPLLSKIYLKDSDGATVHGFDAVHVAPDPRDQTKKSLWLGESKLYTDGKAGVKALTHDIQEHFDEDYLRREFALISKKKNSFIDDENFSDANKKKEYEQFLLDKDYWYSKFDQKTKLEDILDSVTIPMVCTYSSDTFNNHHSENTSEFKEELENEISELHQHFKDNLDIALPVNLNILLILFPVPSKKELVKKLHLRLDAIQKI